MGKVCGGLWLAGLLLSLSSCSAETGLQLIADGQHHRDGVTEAGMSKFSELVGISDAPHPSRWFASLANRLWSHGNHGVSREDSVSADLLNDRHAWHRSLAGGEPVRRTACSAEMVHSSLSCWSQILGNSRSHDGVKRWGTSVIFNNEIDTPVFCGLIVGKRRFVDSNPWPLTENQCSLHFFQLTPHGIPLKETDYNKPEGKEYNRSREADHPFFSRSNLIPEVLYLALVWSTAYFLCWCASWLALSRRFRHLRSTWHWWHGGYLPTTIVALYIVAILIIWHGFIVTQKVLDAW